MLNRFALYTSVVIIFRDLIIAKSCRICIYKKLFEYIDRSFKLFKELKMQSKE